jgi:hypothetical protein
LCTHESWAAGGWERSALLATWERRGRVAETCPSKAQPMRLSCSAQLLSIRLISISTPRRAWKWSSLMLRFDVPVGDDGRSRRHQPTGSTRNWAVRQTSWFAVDGSKRVGVSARKTSDLAKITTKTRFTPPRFGPCPAGAGGVLAWEHGSLSCLACG